jgi:predicted Zn-dependent peptidase
VTDRYRRTKLENGLTVLTETMPGVRSVSMGIWIRAGSILEQPAEMGVSHLLEHMVFKGTPRRTALDLALSLERVGGSLDAYTTREHTSYQARVLDEDLGLALDVLSDLVLNPLLRPADLELEREVVLEEISTVEDTPDDLVFDLHSAAFWEEHPYGYSILGTRESVAALSTDSLRSLHERTYRTSNMVVGAAGNVDHDDFVERVAAAFADAPNGAAAPLSPPVVHVRSGSEHVKRASTQTHLVIGSPTVAHGDPRRYGLILLSQAFGGCMSSRLFQKVREEMGLAYAVFSFQSFYQHAGMSGVYVGTRHEWGERAAAVILDELALLAAKGLTSEELADVKGQTKGQIVLSLESSSARLHRLVGTELYGEPYRTVGQVLEGIDAVTLEETAALAAAFFTPESQLQLRLGP